MASAAPAPMPNYYSAVLLQDTGNQTAAHRVLMCNERFTGSTKPRYQWRCNTRHCDRCEAAEAWHRRKRLAANRNHLIQCYPRHKFYGLTFGQRDVAITHIREAVRLQAKATKQVIQ